MIVIVMTTIIVEVPLALVVKRAGSQVRVVYIFDSLYVNFGQ